MKLNDTNTVLTINNETPATVVAGMGQEVIGKILGHYPLVNRAGDVNIVVLRGWTINGNFHQFNPALYAHFKRR